ncbi:MAG: condensation domain-containing protein, partial [Segetibacter sp.]
IHSAYHQIEPQEQTVLTTNYVFDVSVLEIFSSILSGGCLHIPDTAITFDPTAFASFLYKKKISVAYIHPMYLADVAAILDSYSECYLRKMLIGVEPIRKEAIDWYVKKNISIINGYGPTETTVCATFFFVNNSVAGYDVLPIGKPLPNNKVFILNNNVALVPIGVPGEIYIGGVQVARGYLNGPALTAERFIKDPFSNEEGARLYKTGDVGRWLADGNIEYLGRIDDQVKIRGYRIELGEIENVLLQSGLVSQAVVVAKADATGNKRLVGYTVSDAEIDKQTISTYLHSKLPDYMVPGLWVQLDRLPITPNGKIDKKALPEPDAAELSGHQYVAPRNELEEKLAAIWQQVLNIERAGIEDNFFELGGHSLLAMRLTSAVRKELQAEVAIKDLFLYPTIAQLAEVIKAEGKGLLLPAIEVQQRPRQIPLSFSQERLWFIDQLEGSEQYHFSVILHLKGTVNTGALSSALQTIVDRHEVLRTVFSEGDGHPCQHVNDAAGWHLSMVEGSAYKDDRQALQQYIQQLYRHPFNLSQDYMLRGHLIKLDGQDHVLVVTLHHIASDAWSMAVIVKEVVELYSAYEQGRQPQLPSLPLQFADYAIWQRHYLQPQLEDKLQYWKQKLQGITPLQLPTDYTRPAVRSSRGASARFAIDKSLAEQLQELSRQHGASLYMTLLSAYKILLYRYSNQQDISVGASIANRPQQEVEGLVGFFVNTLTLRDEVSDELSFTELLQQVRTTMIEAYEHQDVPFEKVVDAVIKDRDASRSPLFQVMLVMLNTPEVPKLQLGNLALSSETFQSNVSKFDITFFVTPTARGLQGLVEYSTDLYKAETISRMTAHYIQLLQAIVKAPQQKIGKLPMLTQAEQQQLLVQFNDSIVAWPQDKTVTALFEEQAAKTPQATAVVFEGQQLSYEQLNASANRLAHYLRAKG